MNIFIYLIKMNIFIYLQDITALILSNQKYEYAVTPQNK